MIPFTTLYDYYIEWQKLPDYKHPILVYTSSLSLKWVRNINGQ